MYSNCKQICIIYAFNLRIAGVVNKIKADLFILRLLLLRTLWFSDYNHIPTLYRDYIAQLFFESNLHILTLIWAISSDRFDLP